MSNQQRITALETQLGQLRQDYEKVFKHSKKILKSPFTMFKLNFNFKNKNKCFSVTSHNFKLLSNKPMLLQTRMQEAKMGKWKTAKSTKDPSLFQPLLTLIISCQNHNPLTASREIIQRLQVGYSQLKTTSPPFHT
jgi:hypothetical protein